MEEGRVGYKEYKDRGSAVGVGPRLTDSTLGAAQSREQRGRQEVVIREEMGARSYRALQSTWALPLSAMSAPENFEGRSDII